MEHAEPIEWYELREEYDRLMNDLFYFPEASLADDSTATAPMEEFASRHKMTLEDLDELVDQAGYYDLESVAVENFLRRVADRCNEELEESDAADRASFMNSVLQEELMSEIEEVIENKQRLGLE